MRFSILILSFLAFALIGCGGTAPEQATFQETPVEELYNQAYDLLQKGEKRKAAEAFEEVERQHPYSAWATRAQLMSAYAYYQGEKYQEANLALDRFIQLHPGNAQIAYAYYLRALVTYDQINDIARDQAVTQAALDALREVVRRFPETDYAKDAKLKIDLTLDHLAAKEIQIGRFYQKRRQYIAALNRFRRVVDEYQTTAHVPEALHRLVETYTALGLADMATANAAVLGHNFPGSDWYQYSYNLITTGKNELPRPKQDNRNFVRRALDDVFQ
jgi:outer membrane protein assembly factor BamD